MPTVRIVIAGNKMDISKRRDICMMGLICFAPLSLIILSLCVLIAFTSEYSARLLDNVPLISTLGFLGGASVIAIYLAVNYFRILYPAIKLRYDLIEDAISVAGTTLFSMVIVAQCLKIVAYGFHIITLHWLMVTMITVIVSLLFWKGLIWRIKTVWSRKK